MIKRTVFAKNTHVTTTATQLMNKQIPATPSATVTVANIFFLTLLKQKRYTHVNKVRVKLS